jgi:hypothetical protein
LWITPFTYEQRDKWLSATLSISDGPQSPIGDTVGRKRTMTLAKQALRQTGRSQIYLAL